MSFSNSEETIFAEALRLPADQRDAYLHLATDGDVGLRQRIERLLNDFEAGDFLEQPAAAELRQTVALSVPLTEKLGDRIGRYKLLQKIGEGGCGIVYMAEQEEPVRRRVALKIIKLGMDTNQVIARFEAERQALALMDHPNIAKVLDAGSTDTGRPYFVMELVRGMKITDYCDEARLPVRSRLDLFAQVCQAVQHAHQKGIIHRDLKPSNILVSVDNGVAVPKVIDFGIAKATGGVQLTDKTIFTAFEQFIGTPAYMSPEQAMLTNVDVDTRSDIYALGVLLYEVLTGKTPFETKELLAIGLVEMRRTICEQEPERPSTRLSTLPDNELGTTAQRRGIDAPKLMGQLRGDLDWIVMKCLEKDRARRYETVNGLTADIQHHLRNEPVVACPPSRFYRFQKLLRRNKLAFAAAGAVGISLIAGLAVSTALYANAKQERDEAIKQKRRADQQAAIAGAVKNFLQQDILMQAVGSQQARRGFEAQPDLTVKEALRRSSENVGRRFTNQPLVEAEIRETLGNALGNLGEGTLAVSNLERAFAIQKSQLGPDDAETLTTMRALAGAYLDEGQLTNSLSMCENGLTLSKASFGPHNTNSLLWADALANCYLEADRVGEAVPLLEETLKLSETEFGPKDIGTTRIMADLASSYLHSGQFAKAALLQEKAFAISKATLGTADPFTLDMMRGLATDYVYEGRYSDAVPLFEEALTLLTARLGTDHPSTLWTMNNLADCYQRTGRMAAAIQLAEKVFKAFKAKLGPDDISTLKATVNLAEYDLAGGRRKDVEPLLNEIVNPRLKKHPNSLPFLQVRAFFFASGGQWNEAVPDLARAVERFPEFQENWHRLAAIFVQTDQLDRYRELCRKSVEQFRNASDYMQLHRIAEACLIAPSSGADLALIALMADQSLGGVYEGNNALSTVFQGTNSIDAAFFSTKALAEYRQGRFTGAVDWAGKVFASHPEPVVEMETDAILAMAQQRLNQDKPARAALASCQEIADTKLPKLESGELGDSWDDWIIAHALLREAKTLIEGGQQTKGAAK